MDENYYYDDYSPEATNDITPPVRKYAPTKKGMSPADILASMRLTMVNGRLVMVSTNPDLVDEKGNWAVNPYTGNTIQPPPSPYWGGSQNRPQVGGRFGAQQPQYTQPQPQPQQQPPQLTPQQRLFMIAQQNKQRQAAIKNAMETKSTRLNFVGGNAAGAAAPAQPPTAMRHRPPQMGRFMFKQ